MDLAGLHALLHQPVVVTVATGTKFIGRLETIGGSTSAVTLQPLDAATAAQNDYAINGVAVLDVNSIVFVQHL
jgi:small nuclear ribonucleoprotein (snRNP)-like protein